jgi:signal transduction histidine kinase
MTKEDMTLLLIDDKATNLFALEQLLEKPERKFLQATSGRDGLKLALEQKVDLIILDVQMPEMDGFEVAQLLKSNKRTRDIPIIFASAEKKERQSIIQGFDEGAVDYLAKPLDPELTKAKVSVLLKIQWQKRELEEKNIALERAGQRIEQLNVELQKNLEQLEVANKDLESFSYSVSHDLRAPLRSMIGFSEILEDTLKDSLTPQTKQPLDRIRANANKMNGMIDDLLEFSRLGRQEINKSALDMGEVVSAIVAELERPEKTTVSIGDLLPAQADENLIRHVWTNLISNGIKYSAKAEQPEIQIGSSQSGTEVTYYVRDNGAGFDMQQAAKLFGVFQRLHSQNEFAGTGVGLAIVQRIVARHGGRIWAEAKVGSGATFYFTLPA